MTQRWTWYGYLNECITPWPIRVGEVCTRSNPLTGQHMCIDGNDAFPLGHEPHDATSHTCRCGTRYTPPRVRPRPRTRRQRRAERDARYPFDTPENVEKR